MLIIYLAYRRQGTLCTCLHFPQVAELVWLQSVHSELSALEGIGQTTSLSSFYFVPQKSYSYAEQQTLFICR